MQGRTRRTLVAIGAGLAMAAPAQAVLVINGGFETGNFTGWTRSGAAGFTGVNAADVHGGGYAAFFSPNNVGSIAQTINTRVDSRYLLTFWLRHTVATAVPVNSFSYSWGGQTVQSYSNFGNLPYTRLSATLQGGGLKQLLFSFRDARPTNFYLDDVSLVRLDRFGQPVPEPAAWIMMIAGFGLTGAMMRRRGVVAA
ncbi:MAG: PEPxxWA-CTERM sorting domain-containing protein [Sandarakinorhabdus sp.]|nr:PEPxxWA-CTERM sorting domain-containing protein [Sandarakinorhabdus sp.]